MMDARTDAIPFLTGSGDLGIELHVLMAEIETMLKMGENPGVEQNCTCQGRCSVHNPRTLNHRLVPSHSVTPPRPRIYGALAGLLAACGQVDALRLVEGFARTTAPYTPAPTESAHEDHGEDQQRRQGGHGDVRRRAVVRVSG